MLSDFDLAKQSGEPGGRPATVAQIEPNGVRTWLTLYCPLPLLPFSSPDLLYNPIPRLPRILDKNVLSMRLRVF